MYTEVKSTLENLRSALDYAFMDLTDITTITKLPPKGSDKIPLRSPY